MLPHQVQAGDQLGDWVLHLDAGVHLDEVELAVGGQHELDGAGVDVARGPGGRHGRRAHPLPQLRGQGLGGDSSSSFWLRRWMEQSRSPNWITCPCPSAMIWNSMWRGLTISFSKYISPLPKQASDSLRASSNRGMSCSGSYTRRIPGLHRRRRP